MSAPIPNPPSGLLDMLVLEGLISVSAAAKIRDKVRESWMPIGKILRQRGHLSMDQMMRLLELQSSEPHLRLGELAVREGWCTEEDVAEALRLQREMSAHPLEVFLSEVRCDRDRLCAVLLRYIRQIESRIAETPVQV